jgi:guanyl-specific ribonuclease Sa
MQGYKGGGVFENRNNDLPSQPKGYYKEWDTSSKQKGVDRTPERIVTGKGGEVYYTNTHYGDSKQGPAFLKVNNNN